MIASRPHGHAFAIPLRFATMPIGIARSARLAVLLALPALVAACTLDELAVGPGGTGTGGTAGSSPGAGGAGGAGGSGGSLPTCGEGKSCVPEIPAGWTAASVTVQDYIDANAMHTCPDGSPAAVHFSEPTAASCSACDCSYTGATCTTPGISCTDENDTCGMGSFQTEWYEDENCRDFFDVPNQGNTPGSCKLSAPQVKSKGTCAVNGGEVVEPPWGKVVFVCPLPAGGEGCMGTEVCLSTGGEPNASICVVQANGGECPVGWTSLPIDAFDGTQDTRACTQCGCDTETVTCTGGSFIIHDNYGCNPPGFMQVPDKTISTVDQCSVHHDVFDGNEASYRGMLGTPMPGTCPPTTPSGAVTGTGPHKICCL